MENLKRCPVCHIPPEVKIEGSDIRQLTVTLFCDKDGHMAIGNDLESAKANWNRYISFVGRIA